MNALIVDDEKPARERLRRLLGEHADVHIVGEAAHGLEALGEIDRLKPDVVFLDVEMPELDGIGVAEALTGEEAPVIIFATAFSDYALKAFEVSAVDYVVKPIVDARLREALDKVRARLRQGQRQHDYQKLISSLAGQTTPRRLAVRCGARYLIIDPLKISAVVARDHYAAIVIDGKELLADDSLEITLSRLKAPQFMRVHRGAAINIDFLKELEREGDRKYIAILNDPCQTRVPVSREKLEGLKAKLGIT